MNMTEAWLLTTAGCHLCEEAAALLDAYRARHPAWQYCQRELFDAETPNELRARFWDKIPVLLRDDSQAVLCWPFDDAQLARFLS